MISGMSEGRGWVKLGKTAILERKKKWVRFRKCHLLQYLHKFL